MFQSLPYRRKETKTYDGTLLDTNYFHDDYENITIESLFEVMIQLQVLIKEGV